MCLLFCILYLVRGTQAAPTTNSPVIGDGSEAPSGANFRTLPSIVSTCALTIVARIYSAIHPNIPSPKDSPVLIFLRRLGIMGIALLAPDLLVAWAMRQWLWAYHITAQFNLIVHYTWTQTHSFFALMGGFMFYVNGEPYHTLLPDRLLDLIRAGYIDAPTLMAKQIRDRSKGNMNMISKGLIILQVAWFVLQLISRAICHLETTQLEVGTLAFAVLNFITYTVWWNKPLDILCPHPVYWKSESEPEVCLNEVSPEDDLVMPAEIVIVSLVDSMLRLIGVDAMSPRKLQVPTFDGIHSIKFKPWESNVLTLTGFAIATIFGGIHCTAWFYVFPTYQEQVIWRMSALAITFAPWLAYVAAFLLFRSRIEKRGLIWFTVLLLVFPAVYIAARAILFILMFTTLRNLPPDAYKAVPWTKLVPHL
ncbi:hypothetical protein EDB19DRAFT_1857120 [Suillus lakei]|nr:hypothetical protein EDB19DRAFT_1857120 [Suillus lakei]